MFSTVDKALTALIMAVIYLINTFTSFHFGIGPEVVDAIVAVMSPLLIWAVPNKAPA